MKMVPVSVRRIYKDSLKGTKKVPKELIYEGRKGVYLVQFYRPDVFNNLVLLEHEVDRDKMVNRYGLYRDHIAYRNTGSPSVIVDPSAYTAEDIDTLFFINWNVYYAVDPDIDENGNIYVKDIIVFDSNVHNTPIDFIHFKYSRIIYPRVSGFIFDPNLPNWHSQLVRWVNIVRPNTPLMEYMSLILEDPQYVLWKRYKKYYGDWAFSKDLDLGDYISYKK